MIRAGILAGLLAAGIAAASMRATAEEGPRRSWAEEKCGRYAIAWSDLLARRGREGLGAEFVARHERFIASGCAEGRDVCPRSSRELEVANLLTVAAMNAGTASTFLPFACRD